MGVYLQNVDMAKFNEVLTVQICLDGSIWQQYRGTVPNAKAVPVPEHGRLIEDVAVREQIDEWLNSVGDVVVGRGLSYYGELLGCIEDAPTVIPAEPAEEG